MNTSDIAKPFIFTALMMGVTQFSNADTVIGAEVGLGSAEYTPSSEDLDASWMGTM